MAADCTLYSVDQVRVYYQTGAYCIYGVFQAFFIKLGPNTRMNVDNFSGIFFYSNGT
jgi:hypothetical protein